MTDKLNPTEGRRLLAQHAGKAAVKLDANRTPGSNLLEWLWDNREALIKAAEESTDFEAYEGAMVRALGAERLKVDLLERSVAELAVVATEAAFMLAETNHGGLTHRRSESMSVALEKAGGGDTGAVREVSAWEGDLMPYHCGIGPGLGIPPCEPHITCECCGSVLSVLKRGGQPASWFMNRRSPPGTGWRISWPGDGTVNQRVVPGLSLAGGHAGRVARINLMHEPARFPLPFVFL